MSCQELVRHLSLTVNSVTWISGLSRGLREDVQRVDLCSFRVSFNRLRSLSHFDLKQLHFLRRRYSNSEWVRVSDVTYDSWRNTLSFTLTQIKIELMFRRRKVFLTSTMRDTRRSWNGSKTSFSVYLHLHLPKISRVPLHPSCYSDSCQCLPFSSLRPNPPEDLVAIRATNTNRWTCLTTMSTLLQRTTPQ